MQERTGLGRLDDKCAIVTGAAQGIGAEFAAALAAEGARVLVTDVRDTDSCVAGIRARAGTAEGLRVDVTSNADLAAMVDKAESAFGPVEVLVNNAGIFSGLDVKPFWEIGEDEWDFMMRVNTRGVFQATKACLPSMRKNGRGKVVNVSSGTFFQGPPGFLHYVASKGAVIAMTRSMARELGSAGICVNSIAPGFTESDGVMANTGMNAVRGAARAGRAIARDMMPSDLVGAMLFLASPDSDFVTGQTINVDGGKNTY